MPHIAGIPIGRSLVSTLLTRGSIMRTRDSSITRLGFTCFHLEGCFGDYAPVEVLLPPRSRMYAFARRR
jgi:hypothetical protein